MTPEEQKPLLKDLLAEGAAEDIRQRSLEAAMGALRSRRRVRSFSRGALFVALCATGSFFFYGGLDKKPSRSGAAPSPVSTMRADAKVATVKFISDEELFDLFPGRAVALIGKPGEQKLVFLDGKPTSSGDGL